MGRNGWELFFYYYYYKKKFTVPSLQFSKKKKKTRAIAIDWYAQDLRMWNLYGNDRVKIVIYENDVKFFVVIMLFVK